MSSTADAPVKREEGTSTGRLVITSWEELGKQITWEAAMPTVDVRPVPTLILPSKEEVETLKRRVDIIYEALKLLLGEDLEKAVKEGRRNEAAK
jgi:hypothetical protein